MFISVDRSGEINDLDKAYKQVSIIYTDISLKSEIATGHMLIDNVTLCIKNNILQYLALPAFFDGELYYAYFDKNILITDDFYMLCKKIGKLSLSDMTKKYFIAKGYCPRGRTLFNEIFRLLNYSICQIHEGKLEFDVLDNQDQPIENDDENYCFFKRTLNEVVDGYDLSHPGMLLSGGADSRLLLLLLLERTRNVQITTGHILPNAYENCEDVFKAKKIGRLVGNETHVVDLDFRQVKIDELFDYVTWMPCCTHLSILFKAICQKLRNLGANTVWSGQNMDAVYGLGPTNRFSFTREGIGLTLRRFYLTEEYFRMLPDVAGKADFRTKILACLGCSLFNVGKKEHDFHLPISSKELIYNFEIAPDYSVLSHGEAGREFSNEFDDRSKQISTMEIKKKLFSCKLAFLKGGDAYSIVSSGKMNGLQAVFPYSDAKLIRYFENTQLHWLDVKKPKRFVYRYISEFEDKYGRAISEFSSVSKNEIVSQFGHVQNMGDIYKTILHKTEFGMDLSDKAGMSNSKDINFQHYLSSFWIKKEIEILEHGYGVDIIES